MVSDRPPASVGGLSLAALGVELTSATFGLCEWHFLEHFRRANFREQVTRLLSTVTDSPIDRVNDLTVAWIRSGNQ
jgi:hypothetical protein